MLLRREFTFDAAHRLVEYHGKCERLHGHTYKMAIVLEGTPDAEGMIVDFVELKRIVNETILSKLDHSYLNDLLPQPSAENIARYVFESLDASLERDNCSLREVQIWETAACSVTFGRCDL